MLLPRPHLQPIQLGSGMGTEHGSLKKKNSPPGDSNVQPWLRTPALESFLALIVFISQEGFLINPSLGPTLDQ